MKKVLLKTDQKNPAIQKYIKVVKEGQVIVEFLKESNAIEDVWDAKSLLQAIRAWKYLDARDELTISDILQTHEILMKGKLDPDETGAFRKRPVWIGGHEAKPWYVIPELMEEWIKDAMTSLVVPGQDGKHFQIDHISFEAIHPFIDGNGRMGRILLNWQRRRCGLSVLIYYEKEKFQKYYPLFQEQV